MKARDPRLGRTPSSAPVRGNDSRALSSHEAPALDRFTPDTVRRLSATAGNRAVGRVLARRPTRYNPMDTPIETAEALYEGGWLDTSEQSIRLELSKKDNKLRGRQLNYLRAIEAFQRSPAHKLRQKPTTMISADEQDKLVERRSLEGTIASAGELKLGYIRAGRRKGKHASEQLALLKGDVKIVQEEFKTALTRNTDALLDDSQQRIEHVLSEYGLVTAFADKAVSHVFNWEGDLDEQVEQWLLRARKGQKAAYEDPKATGKRERLGKRIDELRALQRMVVDLQVAFLAKYNKVPLDEFDRRAEDKKVRKRDDTEKWIFGGDIPTDARNKEEEIQKAGRALTAAWIKAEREHPILAAHRDGQQRHLEFVDLAGYSGSHMPGKILGSVTDPLEIKKAQKNLKKAPAKDAHDRAVIKQALRKLVNIHRTRLAIRQNKLSRYKLAPVVAFTREQLLIHPTSVWGVAIDALIKPYKGPLQKGLEYVKDFLNVALMVLAAVPNPLQPLAALYDVARGAYTTMEEYVKYDLQKAYSDTHLDKARSISDEEPSLTGFVVSLVATGMGAAQARTIFKQAAAARRALLAGDDAARRTLNDLGERHGAGRLGDDIANEAGIASRPAPPATTPAKPAAKPPATTDPKPKPPAGNQGGWDPTSGPPAHGRKGPVHYPAPADKPPKSPPKPDAKKPDAKKPDDHKPDDTGWGQRQPPDRVPPGQAAKPPAVTGGAPTETAGMGGIRSISQHEASDGSTKTVIEGELLPGMDRAAAPNYNKRAEWKTLRDRLGLEGEGKSGWPAAHLWGPGFGDEARAGMLIAPWEVNALWHNLDAEAFLRAMRKEAAERGHRIYVRGTSLSHPPSIASGRALKATKWEFWSVGPGGKVESIGSVGFSVGPPPRGGVFDLEATWSNNWGLPDFGVKRIEAIQKKLEKAAAAATAAKKGK